MESHIFRVVIEPDEMEDGTLAFHASGSALKGCHTWGIPKRRPYIEDAVELYVEHLRETGEPIPVDPERGA